MMNRLFSNVLQRLKPSNHGSNGSWESFAGPFILFDERLNVVKANQAARRLFSSYLVEDAVGKNLADIIPDIKETGRYDEYLKVIKTGSPFFASDVVPTSVFGDVRLSVVAFKVGKGLGMVVGDTSRVGKIKAVLEESEAKYRTILETSLDGIYQVDTSGRITFVNDAFADIFGYKTEELLGKQFSSLLDAKTLVKVAGMVAGVFSGKNVKGEVPVIHKDGHKVMVDFSATPLRVRGKIAGLTGMLRDVTERKKAEDALRESEERFRHVLENSLDMIYWLNLKTGEYDYVSPSSEKVMGYTSQEMVGLGFRETGLQVYPDDWDIHIKNMLNLLEHPDEKDKYSTIEYRFNHKKLGYRWMSDCRSVIYDADNTPIALVGALRDVTERKQAEETIRESEERYKALVENAYDVINVIRRDGTIAYRSPGSGYVPGLKIEDYTGMSGFDWVHPDDISKCMNAFAEVMEKPGAVVHIELRTKYIDDSWHTAEANASNLLDNKAVEGIVVHWHDITERKRAEQTLQANEERFRNVLDNSLDMVYRLNLQTGTYDYVSPSTEKILGYSPEEFVAFTIEKGRSLTHPDDLARLDENVIELVTSKAGTVSSIEYRIKHKEWGYRWVSDSRSAVYDDADNPVAVVGNLRDITERKKAEEDLGESEKKYRTLFESMVMGVVYQSADGAITSANLAAERILGLAVDQMQGRTSIDPRWRSIHEDGSDFPGETHPAMVALRTGQEVHNVIMGVFDPRKEDYTWIDINAVPQFRSGEDKPYQVYTIFEDITERKRAEEALRESEERLKDAMALGRTGYWEFDVDTQKISWSDHTFRLFERDPSLGAPTVEEEAAYYSHEQAEKLREYARRAIEEGEVIKYDFLANLPSGRSAYMMSFIRPIKNANGLIVKLFGVFHDITERKQMENALRQSEARFRTIFEGSVLGIGLVDVKGRPISINPALETILGYTIDELRSMAWTDHMHPDDATADMGLFREMVVGKRDYYTIEKRYLKKDREMVWGRMTLSAVRDPSGKFQFAISMVEDITAQKKSEEAIRESEERYRALVDTAGLAGEGIMIAERNTEGEAVIVFANGQLANILGYEKKEELIGMFGRSLFLPGDRIWLRDRHKRRRKGEEPTNHYGVMAFRKDGSMVPIEVSMGAMKYQGKTATVVYVRDVSDRKKAEEALRETRDYLENLLNFASAPIVVWDPEFRITRFNRAFEHLTGYKAGEIIGRELRILFPQASRDKSLNEISRTLTGEHWESVEIPILCKDGEIKLVLWNSSNVYAGDGVTLLAIIAQGIDITERKQAQEKLRESEERFRSLIENALDVIVIVDADAKIVYASPSVERVLGYKPKELIGKDGLSYAHPDDAANAINILGKMEKNHDAPVYVQLRIKHKDGLWRIVEAVGKNMLDNPSVSGIVVNYRDVTERETAHRELVKHTRRVEALHSIAETASQTLEMEELLDTALGKVLEVMDADAGCIYLLDVVEKELVLKTCKGVSEESISQISTIKLGKKNMGKMLQWNGEIIALQEIFGDTAMSLASESLNGAQIQSFAVAPFAVRGQFYGLIAVGNHSHCEISLADVDLLRAVGNQIGVGTQNAVLFEEVRALIRETMEAQEKERERVCLEVHDGVAQTLVSAFQFLQTMEATMPDDKQNKQLLAKATAQVRQAIQESREVINTLQPATLKDLGLVATLRQEMRNLGKETGLRIEFKSDDIRLPKDIETGLYRIIHEAVVNARKHAGCNHLRIRIHDVDGRLKVEVKDWGKGFDQASLDRARRRGTGLFSIHKRAEILKGTCDIHSKPGQGTTVNVEIPMSTVALK